SFRDTLQHPRIYEQVLAQSLIEPYPMALEEACEIYRVDHRSPFTTFDMKNCEQPQKWGQARPHQPLGLAM
ncbi:MAG: hypothetical protein D6691_04975, partial [Candidatus Hydrogenedentota bacterium]